jgi:quinone-modifying oxidoreductase subunit QmoA
MTDQDKKILVVGGGISGLTAALEAAEAGHEVVLVERNPYLGGRVAQLHHYFPKLCPPYCGLEINFRRVKANPRLEVITMAEVGAIKGEPGNYTVTIKKRPRYVNEKCTACDKCAQAVSATIKNPFNYGMDEVKAAYLPHELAYPYRYVIDPSIVDTDDGKKAAEACPYDAVVLDDKEEEITIEATAVVWAAGWQPYDPLKLETYNFDSSPDIVTNVQFERLAAANGPTDGKLLKPSNGEPPKNVAFIQCAGSRDENHLPFCSTICCLASLKQSTYVREQYPDSEVTIYFIDIRAMARNEDFYTKVKADEGVKFVKSKIARIETEGGKLVLEGENTATGGKFKAEHDMVVLATGMQPNTAENKIPADIAYDDYGFPISTAGVIACGTVRSPMEVANSTQDGTAAALKAIQTSVRR